jgi:hypothetical protein
MWRSALLRLSESRRRNLVFHSSLKSRRRHNSGFHFLVSCETLILISAGLFLAGISALAASRVLGHLLFAVSASDPLTLASATIALAAVAALTAYVQGER